MPSFSSNTKNQVKLPSSTMVKLGLQKSKLTLTLLGVAFVFSVLLLVIKFKPPQIHYSLIRPSMPAEALPISHTPVFSLEKVQNWSGRAVNNIFTFGFLNASDHFNAMRPYFNQSAWSSFISSISDTKLVHKVKDSSLLVQITPLAPPYVAAAPYQIDGQWVWPRIEVPVMISYIGALNNQSTPSQKITFILSVLEVSPLDSPDGLQIASLVPTTYDGP